MRDSITERLDRSLRRLNELTLNSRSLGNMVSSSSRANSWCGTEPASQGDILGAEERLGTVLPPSYRAFLALANGWSPFGGMIERMLRVQEIERLEKADPEALGTILGYNETVVSDRGYELDDSPEVRAAIRPRYYPGSILVGTGFDGELVLLNPKFVSEAGEWETLMFAHWIPGNMRFRTFANFVEFNLQTEEDFSRDAAV